MSLARRLAVLWPLPWLIALLGLAVHILGFELWQASEFEQCYARLLVETNGVCAGATGGWISVAILALVAAGTSLVIIRLMLVALRPT